MLFKLSPKLRWSVTASLALLGTLALINQNTQAGDSSSAPKNGSSSATAPAKAVLSVTTVAARSSTLPLKLLAHGNVAAWQEASVGAEVDGLRIAELHVGIGDMVQRGQLLASFADDKVRAELAQAQAAFNEAKTNLQDASVNATRARNLQDSGSLSSQQIEQYQSAEHNAKARLEASKAALDIQQLRLKHTRVVAPDSGQISARSAALGTVAGNGVELFRLIRQNRLEWRAEVTASDIGRLQTGLEVKLTAPSGSTLRGKVRQIAPTLDPQTRIGLVYVDLLPDANHPANSFKPGMYVKGEFNLGQSNAMVLPQAALVVRDGFTYGFRLNPDNRVSQIKLQTGRRIALDGVEQVEVLDGLKPGMVLVASGAGFLNDGDLVKVVNANNANNVSNPPPGKKVSP